MSGFAAIDDERRMEHLRRAKQTGKITTFALVHATVVNAHNPNPRFFPNLAMGGDLSVSRAAVWTRLPKPR